MARQHLLCTCPLLFLDYVMVASAANFSLPVQLMCVTTRFCLHTCEESSLFACRHHWSWCYFKVEKNQLLILLCHYPHTGCPDLVEEKDNVVFTHSYTKIRSAQPKMNCWCCYRLVAIFVHTMPHAVSTEMRKEKKKWVRGKRMSKKKRQKSVEVLGRHE